MSGPDHLITLVDHDPAWAGAFRREHDRIAAALEEVALQIEHVGSTAVAGLAAKPVVDVLLVVADSADEGTYAPSLESAGYVLHIREPGWYEHRMFRRPAGDVHVHVFSSRCPEVDRMLSFRDRLRRHDPDRLLYERTKRELARRRWRTVQDYANAKTAVIDEIVARAATMR